MTPDFAAAIARLVQAVEDDASADRLRVCARAFAAEYRRNPLSTGNSADHLTRLLSNLDHDMASHCRACNVDDRGVVATLKRQLLGLHNQVSRFLRAEDVEWWNRTLHDRVFPTDPGAECPTCGATYDCRHKRWARAAAEPLGARE